MSVGDPGPYLNEDSDIWVPRTVPWKDARAVALDAVQEPGFVIRYVGKTNATLFGFSRGCLCDESCEQANHCRSCGASEQECSCDTPDPEDWDICLVPAWHFRQGEPYDFAEERAARAKP